MSKQAIMQDELDAVITAHVMKGDSITKIALAVGRTERTIQMRWKKIIKRLHCKSTAHAAGKLAIACVKARKRFPPNYSDLLKIFGEYGLQL